jgi:hypothetical protein
VPELPNPSEGGGEAVAPSIIEATSRPAEPNEDALADFFSAKG